LKIAIIGSGVSGLTAAYLLNAHHDITLYEKEKRLGGHAHTRRILLNNKTIDVDIGFIVFNARNYPHLTALFKHLGVHTTPSDMSFGVSINNAWLEYGTPEFRKLFAQKRNFLRPQFLGLLKDILRFNARALDYINRPDMTLGQVLDELQMGTWFKQYFILPMGGAIWSTSLVNMESFPASTFIRFFKNHGLLTTNDQPQWHTVTGGSQNYVKAISHHFKDKIKTSCGVKSVTRKKDHILLTDNTGKTVKYDHVIFACHSDQALKILQNPHDDEQDILSNITYKPNKLILHTDANFMPKRKAAWTSWSYISEEKEDRTNNMSLTYWMNNLQPLETQTDIFVTLNPHKKPSKNTILHEATFEHPLFDQGALNAQDRFSAIQGRDRIHYCGAWQKYGFHEDGCLSAVNVAKDLGATIPWA